MADKITCSKFVKKMGFKSIAELAEITHTPVSTLNDWYKVKRERFLILTLGAIVKKKLWFLISLLKDEEI